MKEKKDEFIFCRVSGKEKLNILKHLIRENESQSSYLRRLIRIDLGNCDPNETTKNIS